MIIGGRVHIRVWAIIQGNNFMVCQFYICLSFAAPIFIVIFMWPTSILLFIHCVIRPWVLAQMTDKEYCQAKKVCQDGLN